jgi:hypothetical protein
MPQVLKKNNMKKLILSFAAVAFSITCGFAQMDDTKETYFSASKAAKVYSFAYDAQEEGYSGDQIFHFAGGTILTISVGNYPGIQPEMLASQKESNDFGNQFVNLINMHAPPFILTVHYSFY